MNELTLFDQVADDPALKEELDNEPFQEETLTLEAFIDKYKINTTPDDLSVIRLLSYDNQFNNWEETSREFIGKQMTNLELEDDKIADREKFEDRLVNEVCKIFYPIAQTLEDTFYIAAEEMHSMFLGPNEDNIEYLAYLYNLNAPYHEAKVIPYQELKKAFQEGLSNKQ